MLPRVIRFRRVSAREPPSRFLTIESHVLVSGTCTVNIRKESDCDQWRDNR